MVSLEQGELGQFSPLPPPAPPPSLSPLIPEETPALNLPKSRSFPRNFLRLPLC